jgi:hypothetical protein
MTLPASGALSLSQVLTELGLPAGTQINFNDSRIRALTGTAADTALRFPTDFYGKSFGGQSYTSTFTQFNGEGYGNNWTTNATDQYRGSYLFVRMDFNQYGSGFIDYGIGVEIGGTHPQNFFSSLYIPSVNKTFTSNSADLFDHVAASVSSPEYTGWYWYTFNSPFTVPELATGQIDTATLSYRINY